MSLYDFPLIQSKMSNEMPEDLFWRLYIERFANKVSRLVYLDRADPTGLSSSSERPSLVGYLWDDYRDLESKAAKHRGPLEVLHVRAVGLHLRLSALFNQPEAENYRHDLIELYWTTNRFLEAALAFSSLRYAGTYITWMMLAGGFTLMKMLNSSFARHTDLPAGRKLFNATISAIRASSIANNDLPSRLAEVLAQLWRCDGAGMIPSSANAENGAMDESLQLRSRCRMSMSVVNDSVLRWRERYQFKGDGTTTAEILDTNNPTDPNLPANTNSAIGTATNGEAANVPTGFTESGLPILENMGGINDTLGNMNFEMFDPLTWMLDGDFPFDNGDAGATAAAAAAPNGWPALEGADENSFFGQ